ncbi:hypothetical protein ENH_00028100, partial [Eimeria necatrix]
DHSFTAAFMERRSGTHHVDRSLHEAVLTVASTAVRTKELLEKRNGLQSLHKAVNDWFKTMSLMVLA